MIWNLVIMGLGKGFLPVRHQSIAWVSANLLAIWPLGTYFNVIYFILFHFWFRSFQKMSTKWLSFCSIFNALTHWGWVTQICISKLTIIYSGNGLSPGQHQAIIWYYAGILLTGSLITKFSEILNEIQTFSLRKIRLKMLSVKCCPFRVRLNVLKGTVVAFFKMQLSVGTRLEDLHP